MASTYSNYKIELITTGEQPGTWGTTTNANFGNTVSGGTPYQGIEQAIGGYASISYTTSLALTDTNGPQNGRALFLNITGAPGADATITIPSIQKLYFIKNSITTYDLIVKTSVLPTGTYGRSGNTVTVTVASTSNYSTGQTVNLTFSAGTGGTATSGKYQITVINSTQFTVTDSASGSITGSPNVDIASIVVPNGKTACVYADGTQIVGTSDWLPSLTTSSITASGTATIGGSLSVGGTSTGSTYSTYTKTSTKITVNGTGFPFVAGDNVYVALTGGDAPSGVYTVDSSPTPTATAFTATPVFGSFPTGTTGGTVNSVTRYNNTTTIQTPLSSFGSSGTTGQVLVSQGAGIPPTWSTVSSIAGNWTVGGNLAVTGTSTFTGAATFNGNTTVGSTSTVSGTYGRSGTTVTITSTAHGFTTGQPMYLVFSAGTGGTATNGVYSITVVDSNTFTVTDAASGTITGSPAVVITRAGTYGRSTTTVNVTSNSHGFSNGQVLYLVFSAGTGGTATSGVYAISNVATNTFDVTDTASGTITGAPSVYITKYNNTATLQAPLSSFGSVGTSGFVLTSQGTGAPPQWIAAPVTSVNDKTGAVQSVLTQGTTITTSTTSFTGSGSSGATTITSSSVTGTIQVGQMLSGTGIASGASITAINGSTLTLSTANTGTVSGTITVVGVVFADIPSWAKRISVYLSGFSTSGTSAYLIQLGTASGFETSGYVGSYGNSLFSSGFLLASNTAANIFHGEAVFSTIGNDVWIGALNFAVSSSASQSQGAGTKSMPGTLDRLRLTTVNGTDTLDAGLVNIIYE